MQEADELNVKSKRNSIGPEWTDDCVVNDGEEKKKRKAKMQS